MYLKKYFHLAQKYARKPYFLIFFYVCHQRDSSGYPENFYVLESGRGTLFFLCLLSTWRSGKRLMLIVSGESLFFCVFYVFHQRELDQKKQRTKGGTITIGMEVFSFWGPNSSELL